MTQNLKPDNIHTAFEWIRSEPVQSLNLIVEEYRHKITGTHHYHLSADNNENVFLVALRTIPTDSTGVAHILEHTALCGSKRYPVRDPFFMMIRRSLNTFMNAFTSSDWTAYPFASQNRKDFDNLLDVYLDAVFFSNLNELDFLQEGHRLEFEKPDDPTTPLVYKGVVFNEMKGAMGSTTSTLWQTLTEHLFPTTTYHYNSGGDPEHIPDLGYDQLLDFYKTHYHPSNAIFMTYGDIPAREHHQRIEELALSKFDRLNKKIGVNDELRYTEPKIIEDYYALDESEITGDKTHIVMGWLLGRSIDLDEQFRAQLLSGVLLDNSASPLRKALETTDLGSSPSPLCGVEDSNREMSFMCGIEGSKPENAAALEALVIGVLEDIANNGVPVEQMEAVLHQLELEQREVSGGHYPYGLSLILDGISAAVHDGDPVALLNLDPVLEKLHEDIKNPDFIKGLVRDLLLNNRHRVRLTMIPDPKLNAKREQNEAARLAVIKNKLSDSEKQHIIAMTKKLEQRQLQEDDEEILPKVDLTDVPEKMHIAQGEQDSINGSKLSRYSEGTNGLVYQQIVIDMPFLDTELLPYLSLYTNCMTEVGVGKRNYLETQEWQANVCGGINAYNSIRGKTSDVQSVSGYLFLSSKSLARNQAHLCELMAETLNGVRFDELDRLRELIAQIRAQREQSVVGQGHSLAMLAATGGMSPAAALSNRLGGLESIRFIKQFDDSLEDHNNLQSLADNLQKIHTAIVSSPKQFVLIGEENKIPDFQKTLESSWGHNIQPGQDQHLPFTLPETRTATKQLWVASTPVNFCAKAYPAVPVEHEDAAALTVLGGFLRNGFLHRAVREHGGAYGGGASYQSDIAAFKFYSYRDPRTVDTLNDFDLSIEWLMSEKHEPRQIEEAILGVVSSIDKPGSPAGEARDAFQNALFGRTPEQRQAHRARILGVTQDDLIRVGGKYFGNKAEASTVVITNATTLEEQGDLGLDVNRL